MYEIDKTELSQLQGGCSLARGCLCPPPQRYLCQALLNSVVTAHRRAALPTALTFCGLHGRKRAATRRRASHGCPTASPSRRLAGRPGVQPPLAGCFLCMFASSWPPTKECITISLSQGKP